MLQSITQGVLSLLPSWSNSASHAVESHSVSQPLIEANARQPAAVAAQQAKAKAIFCESMLDQFKVLHTLRTHILPPKQLEATYTAYSARHQARMQALAELNILRTERLEKINATIEKIKDTQVSYNTMGFWERMPVRSAVNRGIETWYQECVTVQFESKSIDKFLENSNHPLAPHVRKISQLIERLNKSQGLFSFFTRRAIATELENELTAATKVKEQIEASEQQELERAAAAAAAQQAEQGEAVAAANAASERSKATIREFFAGTQGAAEINRLLELEKYQIPADVTISIVGNQLKVQQAPRSLNTSETLTPDEYLRLNRYNKADPIFQLVPGANNLKAPQGAPPVKEEYQVSDLSYFCTIGASTFGDLKGRQFGSELILEKSDDGTFQVKTLEQNKKWKTLPVTMKFNPENGRLLIGKVPFLPASDIAIEDLFCFVNLWKKQTV